MLRSLEPSQFGAIPGIDILGDIPPPNFKEIHTHILVFPNAGQAPVSPYGQIRSQTSRFRRS